MPDCRVNEGLRIAGRIAFNFKDLSMAQIASGRR
jgi:hypothetical protein